MNFFSTKVAAYDPHGAADKYKDDYATYKPGSLIGYPAAASKVGVSVRVPRELGGDLKKDRDIGLISEDNNINLVDAYTDSLIVPGKVDRSVATSKALIDAIGTARRNALTEYPAAKSDPIHPGTDAFNKLYSASSLSAPIIANNLRFHRVQPVHGYTDVEGDVNTASYVRDGKIGINPAADSSFLTMNFGTGAPPKVHVTVDPDARRKLLGVDPGPDVKEGSSEAKSIERQQRYLGYVPDIHSTDVIALSARQDLRHELAHASTGYRTPMALNPSLHAHAQMAGSVLRGGYDPHGWHEPNVTAKYMRRVPAKDQESLIGLILGGDNTSGSSYERDRDPEALRAIHIAKQGLARHLIETTDMTSEQIAAFVQNPDNFLKFMQSNYPAPGVVAFPATMTRGFTENEMHRAVSGLEPAIRSLTDPKYKLKYQKGAEWKGKRMPFKERVRTFKKLYPQVRNNTPENGYGTV